MDEEPEIPDTLTPMQRQYAEIGQEIGKHILSAGKRTAEEIRAALESRAVNLKPSTAPTVLDIKEKSPDPSTTAQTPQKPGQAQQRQASSESPASPLQRQKPAEPMPNAGWLHIEPGKEGGQISTAGRAAIGLADIQQRAAAYGIKPPEWLNTIASVAKVGSAVMGDTHLYGNRLRERVESLTDVGPMIGPPTSASGVPNLGVALTESFDKPRPRASMGPVAMAEAAGPGLQGGPTTVNRPASSGPGAGSDASLDVLKDIRTKMDRIIEAMSKDDGEDETVENRAKTVWTDADQTIHGASGTGPRSPITVSGGGESSSTRPHQQAASQNLGGGSWVGEIVSLVRALF